MSTDELEQRVILRLERVGIDGADEDALCEDDAFADDDPDAVGECVRALRERGIVDDLGCYGVRLSLREWARRIVDVVDAGGDEDRIAAFLKGDSAEETE